MNVEEATARYIDSLGADNLERAAHYTAGNHWILLWNLVLSAAITWIIVRWGLLDRLQARLEKRRWPIRAFLVSLTFLLVSALLSFPWSIYSEWKREVDYGRSSQPIGDFLFQGSLQTIITALLGALFLVGLYWLMRRTGRRWWLWSGLLTAGAISFVLLLSPILIEPLFNKYQPVPEGPVRQALVEMADQAGIPPDKIYMYDGSRQSNNFTANVSGVLGSARIAISDVAMKEASLPEVRAVTGHEIGHYVLGHIWLGVLVFSLLAILLFYLADRLFPRFARLFGSDARIDEPRGIPVLSFLVGLFILLAMPVTNTLSRFNESEADAYSLRMVNEPDAMAGALVKTAEYRYPRPNPVQEFIFYRHPSVERRVRRAMEWKAGHPAAYYLDQNASVHYQFADASGTHFGANCHDRPVLILSNSDYPQHTKQFELTVDDRSWTLEAFAGKHGSGLIVIEPSIIDAVARAKHGFTFRVGEWKRTLSPTPLVSQWLASCRIRLSTSSSH